METAATDQLEQVAGLPGVTLAVGLPDLHPGKGAPIGCAVASDGIFYPHLAGNDIGCGMSLSRTSLSRGKLKLDRWEKKLHGLEGPWSGDRVRWLREHDVPETGAPDSGLDDALGTIGGGNHFAELLVVEQVIDEEAVARLGILPERLLLLVHSGSRGLGEAVLRSHTDRHGARGLRDDSPEARDYLARHDRAVAWARANRALITLRFMDAIDAESELLLDAVHNAILPKRFAEGRRWLHRKGAAPSDEGPIVIPGSRGASSYVVTPRGDGETNALSLAHGAGRKWARGAARTRVAERFRAAELTRTKLGSRVICENKDLLFEEAPEAYKKIDDVIRDLTALGLAEPVAVLKPLITYKVRR